MCQVDFFFEVLNVYALSLGRESRSERIETLSSTIQNTGFSSAGTPRCQAASTKIFFLLQKPMFFLLQYFDTIYFVQVGTSTWLQHFLTLADLPEEEEEIVQHRLHAEVRISIHSSAPQSHLFNLSIQGSATLLR